MSADIAISLRGVSKVFAIYSNPADRLKQILWGERRKFYQDFLAVSNIDLDICKGETIGIVGRNGSGKSTLLRMICRTLKQTSGEIIVNGRVAALLELGAGFNPEFTGRENVFMKAALLGLTKDEIQQRYDSILAFAEIGKFVEQPVKTYSSGMYSRLAFAVAINADPDILIIDEALSVGDEAFRRKCFSRIEDIRKKGSTVLFVSHSASQIIELCNRAVLMDRGQQLLTDEPKTVIGKYQRLIYAPPEKEEEIRQEIQSRRESSEKSNSSQSKTSCLKQTNPDENKPDDGEFNPHLKPKSTLEYIPRGGKISNIRILTQKGKQVNILKPNKQYIYSYEVLIEQPIANLRCGMLLKTISGVELGGMTTHPIGQGIEYVTPGTVLKVNFRFHTRLTPGVYFLNAGVVGWLDETEEFIHRIIDAIMFRIEPQTDSLVNGYIDFSNEQMPGVEIVSNSNSILSAPVEA
jgi:lipopolysaccharide transport system ATP-binding protein